MKHLALLNINYPCISKHSVSLSGYMMCATLLQKKMYHHGLCARLDKTSTDTWTASLQRLLISRKKNSNYWQLTSAVFVVFPIDKKMLAMNW